ncbi:hypothetical protein EYF80_010458 [Liparis tanakae]|uniref:Uncharacterized protein n=1 Tax=Liparis tanakae TaxID=230148 RepID=A0A4Z2IP30_9TELE|nr:hypothetical protein EYF80_010458 [Liparis tanakae]
MERNDTSEQISDFKGFLKSTVEQKEDVGDEADMEYKPRRIEGVVLVVDLGLEAEAEALQSAQAAAHLF